MYLLGLLLSSALQSRTFEVVSTATSALSVASTVAYFIQDTGPDSIFSPVHVKLPFNPCNTLTQQYLLNYQKNNKIFHLIYISFLSTVSKIKTITFKVFFLFYRSWTCYSPFFLKNIFTLLFVFHLPGHSSLIHLVIPYNPATSVYCCVPGIFRISYYLSECKFR